MSTFVHHGPANRRVVSTHHHAGPWHPGPSQHSKMLFHPLLAPPFGTNPSIVTHVPSSTCLMSAAAAVPAFRGGASFLQLLLAFIAGGLFFSTAVATVGAFLAIGRENISRVWEVAKIVIGHVWEIFRVGLGAVKDTLLGERIGEKRKLKWKEAWKVLGEKLGETKRAAQEGVEAIRLEASLYAAAVGQPGLISLQYFVDHFTPLLVASTVEKEFRETLADVKIKNIRKLQLTEFNFGTKSPTLMAARAYDLGDDGIAFDMDTKWDSELKATIKMTPKRLGFSIPVTVKNVKFDGVVRVILAPLTADPPGYGAALVSLPTAPTLRLDVRLAGGEITRMPWLRSEIMSTIQKSIADEFLWPKRVVIPSPVPQRNPRTMLSKQTLQELETSDPLLVAERQLAEKSVYKNTNLKREVPDSKSLNLDVLVEDENALEIEEVEEAMRSGHPRLSHTPEQTPKNLWDRLVKRFRRKQAATEK